MPIWTVALYGSRARGDEDVASDIDVLLITSEAKPRLSFYNGLSLSFYPAKDLISKAKAGDLFVLHLIKEAKVLYDIRGHFKRMRQEFRLRNDYSNIIEQASNLGWFLVQHGRNFDNILVANRRIAWCVRSILIARSAEAGQAVFSARELSHFAKSDIIIDLVSNKSEAELRQDIVKAFIDFLEKWGNGDQVVLDASPEEYLQSFQREKNTVAIKTYIDAWKKVDEESIDYP